MNLFHADCLSMLRTFPDASIDAVIADPPYGVTMNEWDRVISFAKLWKELRRVTKPSAAIVLFAVQPFTSALIMSNLAEFRYDWVWVKNRKTGHLNARKMPMRATESICVFSRKATTYNPQMRPYSKGTNSRGKIPNHGSTNYNAVQGSERITQTVDAKNGLALPDNVLYYAVERGLHPNQKPIPLLAYFVRTYTNPGDTVLDFCMGSGSTGVACKQEGREFVGIESDLEYYSTSMHRIGV